MFSENLKRLLVANKMSQHKFAEEVGISQSLVHYFTKGTREPKPIVLKNMANVLGVTVDELLK